MSANTFAEYLTCMDSGFFLYPATLVSFILENIC